MMQLAGVPLPPGVQIIDQDVQTLPGGIAAAAEGSPTVRLRDLPPDSLARLSAAMEVPSLASEGMPSEPFIALERAYSVRRPLAAHPHLLDGALWSIAADAHRDGIMHIELSASAPLLDPPMGGHGWLSVASRTAAAIHRKIGLRILFLATVNRHTPLHSLSRSLIRLDEAMATYPLLVGIDIAGHETNPTADFMPSIVSWATSHVRRGRPVVIRVHAGETPYHPTNVRVALEAFRAIGLPLGMGRIGHALYGIGRGEVALACETGAVVEMGLASNRALGYRAASSRSGGGARLARLIRAGVPTVLVTDGSGIYRTGSSREAGHAINDGAPLSVLDEVIRHEASHIERMRYTFPKIFNHQGTTSSVNTGLGSKLNQPTKE